MIKRNFIITDPNGFHARSANDLVHVANRFLDTALFIETKGIRATLHSILGVLSLAVKYGEVFTITADGIQEGTATIALEEAVVQIGIGELLS